MESIEIKAQRIENFEGIALQKYCKRCKRVTKQIRKDAIDKCLTCDMEN